MRRHRTDANDARASDSKSKFPFRYGVPVARIRTLRIFSCIVVKRTDASGALRLDAVVATNTCFPSQIRQGPV